MGKILTYLFAFIWAANGLYCKLLNGVPRHQQIVESIIGIEYGYIFTKLIGALEIGMAIWILSGYKRKLNATFQMVIIATMNIIEFFKVPDLLLWGRFNSIFAVLLIMAIYFWAFQLKERTHVQ